MIEAAPLLAAKLLPPAPGPHHVARPRLMERLRSGLEGRATCVVAGPGYGKTTLVGRFLSELEGDAVWFWVDASDRDPWMLFRYLGRGLKEHAPEFGERSAGLWNELLSHGGEVERLADIFIKDAEESLGGRLVLVLDGVHLLEDGGPCARALQRLLAYLPGALHLVLVGRALPDLGVRPLKADPSINLIEGDELRFTLEETRSFLESLGLQMQPDALARLHERTRGWVTALQLLRQTARLRAGAADLPEEVFAGTVREIFDYFSEEVLAAETEEVRRFLLESSPPATIDPEVCGQVLAGLDVRGILSGLLRRNLFIAPLESRAEYYAYDPLFRDFLVRKERADAGADGTRDLHLRYGRAFGRRGDFGQALRHLIAAEDGRGIAALLRRHGKSLLRAGMLDAVREAALFVAERGGRSAVVDDLLGEASRLAGDHAAAVGHFENALAVAPEGAGLSGNARASSLQGLAYSLLKTGEVARAAGTAEAALREVGDDDPALRARILNTLSIVRYRENRHDEALAGWQEALARARQAGDAHLTLMVAHNLGLPHAVKGDFRRASECFLTLTGPDNPRTGPEEGAAYLNLARIEALRGEYGKAAALLGDAHEIARTWKLQGLMADVLETEGTLLRDTGNFEAARASYARARALLTELGQLDLLDSVGEEEAILAARAGDCREGERLACAVVDRRRAAGDQEGTASALLALGEILTRGAEPARAAPALAESAALFAGLERAYQQCMADLWLARARHAGGDAGAAREAAERAFHLATRFDYRASVLRVAGLDAGFRRFLTRLPSAPAYLGEAAGEEEAGAPPALRVVEPSGADLTARLLGPIQVYRDPQRAIPAQAWRIKRALHVFCYLAGARDHRATKDRLADALWGDARPSVIERNFHPTISFLRRALNHGHNVPKNFILCERGAYLLNPEYRYDLDTKAFEETIRKARGAARAGRTAEALADYDAALATYRGPFLDEEYAEWAEATRTFYENLHLEALAEAGDLHLEQEQGAQALDCFRRLVEHDALSESGSARLMKAYGALGDRAAVEKEFARLARALREELDTDPLPETDRARRAALDAAERFRGGAAAASTTRRAGRGARSRKPSR
jgi:LuxR family maltose regulon positive regulatory protein